MLIFHYRCQQTVFLLLSVVLGIVAIFTLKYQKDEKASIATQINYAKVNMFNMRSGVRFGASAFAVFAALHNRLQFT